MKVLGIRLLRRGRPETRNESSLSLKDTHSLVGTVGRVLSDPFRPVAVSNHPPLYLRMIHGLFSLSTLVDHWAWSLMVLATRGVRSE